MTDKEWRESIADRFERLEDKADLLLVQVAELRGRAGAWGAVAGLVVGGVVSLIVTFIVKAG